LTVERVSVASYRRDIFGWPGLAGLGSAEKMPGQHDGYPAFAANFSRLRHKRLRYKRRMGRGNCRGMDGCKGLF
jgi:hypothetical protein